MAEAINHSLSYDRFLVMAANVLHKGFFEKTRTEAKKYFRDLEGAKQIPLTRVVMEDESTMDLLLSMDLNEYCGTPSYSVFRTHLALLLNRIKKALDEKEKIEILSDEAGVSHVFKLPVLHSSASNTNVLVLGWRDRPGAQMELQIIYLDPQQFAVDKSTKA